MSLKIIAVLLLFILVFSPVFSGSGPSIIIHSPANSTYNSNVLDINISVIDNASVINSVRAFVDDIEVVLSNIGDYWFFYDYSFDNNSPITLVVNASNAGGLNSSASSSFYVDNASPVISLLSPTNNSFVNSHQSDFNFTASDNLDLVL